MRSATPNRTLTERELNRALLGRQQLLEQVEQEGARIATQLFA